MVMDIGKQLSDEVLGGGERGSHGKRGMVDGAGGKGLLQRSNRLGKRTITKHNMC